MVHIVMADDGISFNGQTIQHSPLGGAEAAFGALAEAFAARGHQVQVFNRTTSPINYKGVEWHSIEEPLPKHAELYVANRSHHLIGQVPKAQHRIFWIHNPGSYLNKFRYLYPLWRYKPTIVTSGIYHASTLSRLIPSTNKNIPLGLPEAFRHAEERPAPAPIAVFISNPLRGLDWLLKLWEQYIHPAIPEAELHIYSGASVYGNVGDKKANEMASVLQLADSLAKKGVKRLSPLPQNELITALLSSRLMLYRGDPGETFCLAVAQAQALGIPAVVQALGSLSERVIDQKTGRVAKDETEFAEAAIQLLKNDRLWLQMHRAALQQQRGYSWNEIAEQFEKLMD